MITATIFNHAGGAGKTSITRDVGYQFAQVRLRVLLADLDPQANLSSWLGVRNVSIDATVYDLATTGAPLPEPVEVHGLHVIRIPFVSPTIQNFTGLPAPRPEPA